MVVMKIEKNVSLGKYSTMRLGGKAKYFAVVRSKDDLSELLDWAEKNKQKLIMVGGGSNLIWQDQGFDGLVILNRLKGLEIKKTGQTDAEAIIASGENWDDVVVRTVKAGYSGIELLSYIPGRTGATPVQNVGAYGREIGDVLVSVSAYDTKDKKFVEIPKSECGLGYRSSRFKTTDKGRFLITAVTIRLSKENSKPPFYASLQAYLDENNITDYTPANIRSAVIAVRTKKLPDPDVVANNGSFFANPIIEKTKFDQIKAEFPEIVFWPVDDNKVKLAAGWLVENAGFKDYYDQETGMATWDKQALVIINKNAKTTADVLAFKKKIVDAVNAKYGIKLEQEPELVG